MATRKSYDDVADGARVERDESSAPVVRAELRTPDEWRAQLSPRASHHACAAQLHGWREHEHHQGEPIRLTEAAYREALAAGAQCAAPSPNAVSPHRGKGL